MPLTPYPKPHTSHLLPHTSYLLPHTSHLIPLFAFCFLFFTNTTAQSTTKNVIFMVPDGTSISVLSLSRWYQFYIDENQTRLAIDPYICGMVRNHSSNAPIGDSAPTMSGYMTGYYSQTGFLSMCPPTSENDLVKVDALLSYTPRLTVMEAARIVQNKAIGLVFTCEYPHATPAATSAHWYKRSDYATIQKQMMHNSIDVVMGGGATLMTKQDSLTLVKNGYDVLLNDIVSMNKSNSHKLWALFGDKGKYGYMDYDWERDTAKQPSLAQMTKKAIELLSENKEKEGFFLMVEGSKIDWAAHSNNPAGILSEFLAFDAAVKVAIDFAQENGETLVVICPDHGCGGLSIGNKRSNRGYDKMSLNKLMEPLKKENKDKKLSSKSYIGFTTSGHTGEDLFLAIYDSRPNERLSGLVTPKEINDYLCDAVGVKLLDSLSNFYYAKLTDIFKETEFDFKIIDSNRIIITPKENPGFTLMIEKNSNKIFINKQEWHTKTPAIYVDKTKTWYLSKECLLFLNNYY